MLSGKLNRNRLDFQDRYLVSVNAGPFFIFSQCSYADIFLYTSVRTVEETGGFGLLRDACDGKPFAGYKTVSEIANAVGEIE